VGRDEIACGKPLTKEIGPVLQKSSINLVHRRAERGQENNHKGEKRMGASHPQKTSKSSAKHLNKNLESSKGKKKKGGRGVRKGGGQSGGGRDDCGGMKRRGTLGVNKLVKDGLGGGLLDFCQGKGIAGGVKKARTQKEKTWGGGVHIQRETLGEVGGKTSPA